MMHASLLNRPRLVLAALGALLLLTTSRASQAQDAARPPMAEPSLSPDGAEIAFASGGDIWTVPAEGGTARLLVTDPATDSRPLYSPDGKMLAFQSTRGGPASLYVLTLATGQLKRLTWSDGGEELDGWSADGKYLYFSATTADVGRQNDIFRVPVTGGTPLEVSRERYLNEFHAAASPDGKTLALMARGNSNAQWWRNGHSHLDVTELWLKPIDAAAPYRKLLADGAKHAWPMWSRDGKGLYFMSDASGAENLWRMPAAGGAPEQLTRFSSGRVLWPSMGGQGSAIVFERDFGIWKYDLQSGRAAAVAITLRGAPASAGERRLNETSFSDMALSPDGRKVAVTAHGEVFAASAKDGGPAQRISNTPAAETSPNWSPDSTKLTYASQRGLDQRLVEYDVAKQAERFLTPAGAVDSAPVYSPDGKMVAYVRNERELHVLTLGDGAKPGKDIVLFKGALDTGESTPPSWSPDSRWVAFVSTDARSFTNISVVQASGGDAHPITFLANGGTGGSIAWDPAGKYLLFSTSQRSEESRIVRVDLLPNLPKYREDAFRDLFKPGEQPDRTQTSPANPAAPPATPGTPAPATPAPPGPLPEPGKPGDPLEAPKSADAGAPTPVPGRIPPKKKVEPVEIVFDGIRERATVLPLGLDARDPVVSPDGKRLVFRAVVAGQTNLYTYSLDELAREPATPVQLTSTRRSKAAVAFSPDSKEITFLEGGVVTSTALETPRPRAVAINAEMDVDFATEKLVVMDQAWSILDRHFYDDKFHGQDWSALRQHWRPVVAAVRTPDEMRRVLNLMIGELNASHSGMGRPGEGFGSAPAPRTADLGLLFDREAYEAGKGLVVREVTALGPADIEGSIKPGDVLLSVNGTELGPQVNLDRLLQNQNGRRTVLRVSTGGRAREAIVRPVTQAVAAGLRYRQWVNGRRAYVEKASGGRLGYVHIADMSDASLNQLYLDLDAQNQGRDGVVIDIRNNNGGYVNGYVLDVITRRNYLMMTERGRFPVPARQNLGQRALGPPTVLVVNESSLSDAEDFTEGYRAVGAGKVVGQPTAGWIIYTYSEPLIDGSTVRVPAIRVQDLRGQTMEMNPRPVDVAVERPLGETLDGRDAQLDVAVAELLKGLPKR